MNLTLELAKHNLIWNADPELSDYVLKDDGDGPYIHSLKIDVRLLPRELRQYYKPERASDLRAAELFEREKALVAAEDNLVPRKAALDALAAQLEADRVALDALRKGIEMTVLGLRFDIGAARKAAEAANLAAGRAEDEAASHREAWNTRPQLANLFGLRKHPYICD